MQKLESLDSSVFQLLDDEESLALIGGGDELLVDDPDGCRGTSGGTATVNGPDVKADIKCVLF